MFKELINTYLNSFKVQRNANTDNKGKLLVTVFAFARATKTNSLWVLNPETLICTQLNSCSMTNFWLRHNLYRDTAPVPIYQISATETVYRPLSNLVPRPRQHSIKFVPGQQKHVPYPPCTVTVFWLKYLDPARCCSRVTQPPHIAGPLGFKVALS
jgi:hypothetical protein